MAQAAAARTALAKGFVQRVHSGRKLAAIGGQQWVDIDGAERLVQD